MCAQAKRSAIHRSPVIMCARCKHEGVTNSWRKLFIGHSCDIGRAHCSEQRHINEKHSVVIVRKTDHEGWLRSHSWTKRAPFVIPAPPTDVPRGMLRRTSCVDEAPVCFESAVGEIATATLTLSIAGRRSPALESEGSVEGILRGRQPGRPHSPQ